MRSVDRRHVLYRHQQYNGTNITDLDLGLAALYLLFQNSANLFRSILIYVLTPIVLTNYSGFLEVVS